MSDTSYLLAGIALLIMSLGAIHIGNKKIKAIFNGKSMIRVCHSCKMKISFEAYRCPYCNARTGYDGKGKLFISSLFFYSFGLYCAIAFIGIIKRFI